VKQHCPIAAAGKAQRHSLPRPIVGGGLDRRSRFLDQILV
jgi:hypothetical protein